MERVRLERLKKDLKAFFYENRWALCLAWLLLILAFYRFLMSDNIRMDSVIKLATPGDEFNDLQLGRFGIVYFNRLTGMRWFSPYVSGYLTLLTILADSGLLCFMTWKALRGQCGRYVCWMPVVAFLTPIWTEQLYFSYQSFQVVLALLFVEIAALLPEYFPSKRWFAVEVLLAFCAFSVYQAMVPLYIALCVGFVLLCIISGQIEGSARLWHRALRHAGVFILALAAYLVLDKLLQRDAVPTDYLSSQVLWGTVPFTGVVVSILRSIGSALDCSGKLETPMYSISLGACLLFMILGWIKDRNHGKRLLILLGWLLLQLSAFAMTIVVGRRAYLRTDLAITFVAAFNVCIAFVLARQWAEGLSKAWLRRLPVCVVVVAALFGICYDGDISFRLMYTDDVRNAADKTLAVDVVRRLRETGLQKGDKTLIFVGEPRITLDAGCLTGETIGRSLFNRVLDSESTNHLIANVIELNGLSYEPLTAEDIDEAEQMARSMPSYPESGSIAESDRVVVVKFSEDYYYDSETIKPGITQSDETVEYDQNVVCHVESVVPGEDTLVIRGSNVRRGVPAVEMQNIVYLLNQKTGELFKINTACTKNIQITNQFWKDDVDYDQGGFIALCPVEVLNRYAGDTFEVLVQYNSEGERRFVSTGVFLDRRRMKKEERMQVNGQE